MTALDDHPVAPPDLAPAPRWAGRRAVLRLARRDALRHKARSALVVAMVALPVVGLAAVDVVARTESATSSGVGVRTLPAGVDAEVRWLDGGPLQQSPDGTSASFSGDGEPDGPPPSDADIARATGADEVLPVRYDSARLLLADGRSRSTGVVQTDLGSPLAPQAVGTVVDGRAPGAVGEVALSRGALQATGAVLGDTVQLTGVAPPLTVVGEARASGEPPAGEPQFVQLYSPPGLPVGGQYVERTWYVTTPEPLRWPDVLHLNEQGLLVVSRAVLADPPPDAEVPLLAQQPSDEPDLDAAAFVVLAAGMGLLEVVLLAGPAFAVGARRSKRVLALLAATGGDRRQVRDVVLAQGLVLGLVGSGAGLALGVLLGLAAVPLVERYTDAVLGDPVLRPLELLAIASVGLVTAVLAALLPARGVSRQDAAVVLAGRREPVRLRAGVPVLGVALAGAGFGVVLLGVERRSPLTILSGAALGQVGLVVCTPAIVRAVGRAGRLLPLTPRLAVRDAARNVGRTAPAVAAVMAAVAGTVASSIFVASIAERDERAYTPQTPPGQVTVSVTGGATDADVAAVEAAVRGVVPVARAAPLRTVGAACTAGPCAEVLLLSPPDRRCPLDGPRAQPPTDAELAAAQRDPRCTGLPSGRPYGGVAVDDGTALPLLTGRDDPAASAVLRGGGAVLLDASRDGAGTAELQVLVDGREQRVERVPVTTADAGDGDWPLPQLLLAPALADRLGLPSAVQELRVQPAAPVTEAQEERVGRALSADTNFVQVERGFRDDYRIGLIALVAAAAVVTVGAVATSTALAMTDARPDLATMAAVGASRSVRRRMAAVTALVLAATGTALGALAGAVPAVAAIRALQQDDGDLSRFSGAWPLVVPWTNLLLIAGAAPLAAGLLVALFTRARLPVVHRRDA